MSKRECVEAFYRAWIDKDWTAARAALTDDFQFRSPADEPPIGLKRYEERCWPLSERLKSLQIRELLEQPDLCMFTYDSDADGKTIRVAEVARFREGKICSIDCYWGFQP